MQFDTVIIGSGPGGYVCAIRCAQLGMKVAIIEKEKTLGGTCLNIGCIPSKALLDSSELFYKANKEFAAHGISSTNLKVNMPQMQKRKQEVVESTVNGLQYLMKKNKIEVLNGWGKIVAPGKVSIKSDKGNEEITTKYIIIATGSEPICPPPFNYDGKRVITSTEALELDKIPKSMIIIGAGVIGLELGSVYHRLGTKIQVVELQNSILPGMDKSVSRELHKTLKKQGFEFFLDHKVIDIKPTKTKAIVNVESKEGVKLKMEAEYCLISIGRKPFIQGLGVVELGMKLDGRGRIEVDETFKTSIDNIYAIGDVIKGPMLAHKAEDEGVCLAEILNNQKPHIDYSLIPGVVYTWPEIASVGKTEEQLKESNTPYKVGKFPMKVLGRSKASMDTDGLVKVLAHKETDELLGVHIFGARAADLIMEAVSLMEFRASAEDMSRICHPHPTYSEAMKESALDCTDKRPIHL